ncbi:hypothetical protein B0H12DRAFT_1322808 [Mycena haematopus]|nr:hypothetical protein B0H12DRAFT_1322808 [Mycena haematopus]
MHIDIVLEVLSFLHPLDLLHLFRTTRDFRSLLHEPALDRIWRESFIAPLPMCPRDISGRRWAHLLFGPHSCEECGRGATLPDFAILRRLCSECMRSLLGRVESLSAGHSPTVQKLVAGTLRLDGYSRTHRGDRRALISEACSVIEEYEVLEQDQGPEPDGSGPLALFVQKRLELVRERYEILVQSEEWEDRVRKHKVSHDAENFKKVQASVEKRLLKEGYDLRDIEKIRPKISGRAFGLFAGIGRLSSRRWNKTRPTVIPDVLWAKQARLTSFMSDEGFVENAIEVALS